MKSQFDRMLIPLFTELSTLIKSSHDFSTIEVAITKHAGEIKAVHVGYSDRYKSFDEIGFNYTETDESDHNDRRHTNGV